jgi:hypothetical protein
MNDDSYFNLWETTPATTNSNQGSDTDPTIPDGQHRAIVSGFECFISKAGDVWMKWSFAVYGGMYDGRPLVKLSAPLGKQTDDEDYRTKQIRWAKQDLHTMLGEIPPVWGGLLDSETRTTGPVVTKLLGAVASVAKKTTKGNDGEDRIRVYINELVSAPSGAPDLDQAPAGPEPVVDSFALPEIDAGEADEIPF